MCKGVNDVDVMKRAMDDFYNIVNGRVEQLKKATQENPWGHEVIELYYAPLRESDSVCTLILDDVNDSRFVNILKPFAYSSAICW